MPDASAGKRLPDFVIIGAMKAGTTSLYAWLGEQAGVWVPATKEPHFFSHRWERGLDWYGEIFAGAPDGSLVGEASTSYTDPMASRQAADRMGQVIPDARLVYLIRDPMDRLRSHYRHQVHRSRERRPFLDAISTTGNEYVASSCFYSCLKPYLETFPARQICVVRFEDLTADDAAGWNSVLSFLGLRRTARPTSARNLTVGKAPFSPLMLTLWTKGLLRPLTSLPAPARRLGKRLLLRNRRLADLLRSSDVEVPREIGASIWADIARLEESLGLPGVGTFHYEAGASRRSPISREPAQRHARPRIEGALTPRAPGPSTRIPGVGGPPFDG